MGESTKKPAAKKPRKTAAQKRVEAEAAQAAFTTPPEESKDEQSNPPEESKDEPPEVDESGQSAEGLSNYKPKQRPLKAAGLDQHAEHAKREAERDAEREEHNRRTGDASRQG